MKEEFYISLVGEAFDGYTEAVLGDKTVYIKHLNIRDQRYLHKYYEKYKNLALDKGLETQDERVAYVLKEEIWTAEDDQKIESLQFEINNLKVTVKNLFLPSQQEDMQKTITERLAELHTLKLKRQEVIGKTAEDYATGRSADEILRFLLFKNKELTEHLYSEEEFGELESWEVAKITELQSSVVERFMDSRIQEAVLKPFFAMYLSLCEDVAGFYQTPLPELTIFQLKVALFGRMFFNMFQFTENIPENIKEDPEKLIAFSEAQRNKDSNKGGLREDSDASVVFGATKTDMESLGAAGQEAPSLAEEAKKHGGKLNMEQLMRLAGHDV